MYNRLSCSIVLLLTLLLFCPSVHSFNITNVDLQIKSSNLFGIMDLTYAQWDITFDENIYFSRPTPCSAGLCSDTVQDSLPTTITNPSSQCYATCDFTIHGNNCGQTSNPQCNSYCQSIKSTYCIPRNWTVLTVNVETELQYINADEYRFFRFNWHETCKAMKIEIFTVTGIVQSWASPDFIEPHIYTNCLETSAPASWGFTCPSKSCYRYGTWFMMTQAHLIDGVYAIKVSAVEIENGPRKITSPPEAPISLCQFNYPGFNCAQIGVPYDVHLAVDEFLVLYQLNTNYCGQIFAYLEILDYAPLASETSLLGISTDPYNPVPIDFNSDQLFFASNALPSYICPKDGQELVSVFFAIARVYGYGIGPCSMIFTVEIDRPGNEWMRIGLGEISSNYSINMPFPDNKMWSFAATGGTNKIVCPKMSNNTVVSSKEFKCNAGSYNFKSCVSMWSGYPQAGEPTGLIPIHETLIHSLTSLYDISFPIHEVSPNVYTVILLMEIKIAGSSKVFNLDVEDLNQCHLLSGDLATISSKDGYWPYYDINVPYTSAECDYSQLSGLIANMQDNIDHFLDDPYLSITNRYLVDSKTFNKPWQGCSKFLNNLTSYQFEPILLENTTKCLNNSDINDPCCNFGLSFNECCMERDIETMVQEQFPLAEESLLTCSDKSCSYDLLSEYTDFINDYNLGTCDPPYQLDDLLTSATKIYRECFNNIFGHTFYGKSCYTDGECSNGYCDLVAHRCIFNRENSEIAFYQCLNDDLPAIIKISMLYVTNYTNHNDNFIQFLNETFVNPSTCVNLLYGHPVTEHSSYYSIDIPYPNCPACEVISTDVSHLTPPWCDQRLHRGGSCSYIWQLHLDRPEQCNEEIFNVIGATDSQNAYVCGNNELHSNCLAVGPKFIGQREACLLSNGTVILTDATTCQNTFTCSDASIKTKNACLSSGHCTDNEDILVAIKNTAWFAPYFNQMDGYCVLPLSPFNSPDCSVTYAGSFPTSIGCISLGDCIQSGFTLTCQPYLAANKCLAAGGFWHVAYPNQAQCLADVKCSENLNGVTINSMSRSGTSLLTSKDGHECTDCAGDVKVINQWISNKWLPGVSKPIVLTPNKLIKSMALARSVNFNAIYTAIQDAVKYSASAQLLNNLQCAYSTQMRLMNMLTCDCTVDSPLDTLHTHCFDISTPNIGAGLICSNTDNSIIISHAQLQISADNVFLTASCTNITLYNLLANKYNPPKLVITTAGFVPVINTYFNYDYLSVKDSKNIAIGQVIGDGISIEYRDVDMIGQMYVCLKQKNNIIHGQEFTVYDFGYDVDGNIRAKYADVQVVDGMVCGTVWANETVTLIPILRLDNDVSVMNTSEVVTAYVIASFFAVLTVVVLFRLFRLVTNTSKKISQQPTVIMWLCLLIMNILRSVYLYLVGARVFDNPRENELVTFFLVNFPLILYMLGVLIVGLVFCFLYWSQSKGRKIKSSMFFLYATPIIILTLAIFFAFFIAFNYTVLDNSVSDTVCSLIIDNSSNAMIIRIVYICTLVVMAILVVIIVITFGFVLWNTIKNMYGSLVIMKISVVVSIAILIDSIAFLIYYAINDPTIYFTIVLVFTEIIPQIIIILIVNPTNDGDGDSVIKTDSTSVSVQTVGSRFD